jgi:hypothetical protein
MGHIIYEGPRTGIYEYHEFEKCMFVLEERKVTEHVITELTGFCQRGLQIWHFISQGVTLRYRYGSSIKDHPVKIELYGKPDAVGEVEKIILEEAGKFAKTS